MPIELINNNTLFSGLDQANQRKILSLVEEETFNPGETIFSRGDSSEALYIVKYGTVKITAEVNGKETQVATLGTGSHFGEMSLVDHSARSATAEPMETTVLLSISYKKLNELFSSTPEIAACFYKSVAFFLCGRLMDTNDALIFSRAKAS